MDFREPAERPPTDVIPTVRTRDADRHVDNTNVIQLVS